MSPTVVYLVGCSDTKRGHSHKAKDLYTGDLFEMSRIYVEQTGATWFILSALHGLVEPDQPLACYNRHLKGLSMSQRRAWGASVRLKLQQLGYDAETRYVILAGKAYRDCLDFPEHQVTAPLAGLSIGRQLAALMRAIVTGEL